MKLAKDELGILKKSVEVEGFTLELRNPRRTSAVDRLQKK
jgi:hypothetical protein